MKTQNIVRGSKCSIRLCVVPNIGRNTARQRSRDIYAEPVVFSGELGGEFIISLSEVMIDETFPKFVLGA